MQGSVRCFAHVRMRLFHKSVRYSNLLTYIEMEFYDIIFTKIGG